MIKVFSYTLLVVLIACIMLSSQSCIETHKKISNGKEMDSLVLADSLKKAHRERPIDSLTNGVDIVYKQPLPDNMWRVSHKNNELSVLQTCKGQMPGLHVDMVGSSILRKGRNWTEEYTILSADADVDTLTKINTVEMLVVNVHNEEYSIKCVNNYNTNFISVKGFPSYKSSENTGPDTLYVDIQFWDHITYYQEQCFTRK